jgi:hypothetical protein
MEISQPPENVESHDAIITPYRPSTLWRYKPQATKPVDCGASATAARAALEPSDMVRC